jgi:hypothetical protein
MGFFIISFDNFNKLVCIVVFSPVSLNIIFFKELPHSHKKQNQQNQHTPGDDQIVPYEDKSLTQYEVMKHYFAHHVECK